MGSSYNPSAVWPAAVVLGDGVFLSVLVSDNPGLALILEPIAFALDLDDVAVVQEPVEHGGGEHAIPGESLIPGAEAEVRGHDG